VRIHLTTKVTVHHVNLGLVHETDGLDIIGCPQELNTSKCPFGDEAGTVAGFCAPCNHLAFDFTDGLPWLARSPEAKVFGREFKFREPVVEQKYTPSKALKIEVWHSEFWFSVVELQMLYPT